MEDLERLKAIIANFREYVDGEPHTCTFGVPAIFCRRCRMEALFEVEVDA